MGFQELGKESLGSQNCGPQLPLYPWNVLQSFSQWQPKHGAEDLPKIHLREVGLILDVQSNFLKNPGNPSEGPNRSTPQADPGLILSALRQPPRDNSDQ